MITRVMRKNPYWLLFRYSINFVPCDRIIWGWNLNYPFKTYCMTDITIFVKLQCLYIYLPFTDIFSHCRNNEG
jgi:hypothetical protein